jgi:O-antigen/teichoic acid export membrane protein
MPLVLFGSSSLIIRFFPNFRDDENGHNGWLGFNLGLVGLGFSVFLLVIYLFRDVIYSFYSNKPDLYLDYLPYAIPFVLFMAILNILGRHSSNFHRIVVPPIFSNILLKISVPTLVILFSLGWLDFDDIFDWTVVIYILAVIATLIYLRYLRQLVLKINFKQYTKKIRKEMFSYGGYGFFGSMSAILATQIDIIMVGNLTDLKKVAAYTIGFFISDVIDVPRRALEGISNPILSEAFKNNDQEKIARLYSKTALTQLTIGLLLFIGIWASIDDLFSIIPNGGKYHEGKYVVLILGIGTLVDQATGINSFVIGYSRFFRFHFWLIVAMGFINIGNNLLFIPMFSVAGAAIATMISKMFYNFSKTLFVWKKMKMHPFSTKYFILIIFALIAYFAGTCVPTLSHNMFTVILGLGLRSALIALIFVSGIYYFKVSEEVNDLIDKGMGMIGISLKK